MEINEINHVLVEWKIEKEIGQGSFGKVYLAKKKIFTQEYYAAIKVITIPQSDAQIAEELASGQTINSVREYFRGVVEDWHSEIKMLERLKGVTNIVGVEDYQIIENEDKLHWDIIIRMEYLTPFNKYIMDHLIDTKDALKLGVDICRALKYCEHQRVLHRDIKPENIFISKFGDYKLGDFGIARQLEKTTSNLSRKGTYLYMAPEVYRGEEYDHTVDIYSLGIVMYRLFNQNKLPFIPLDGGVMRATDKENSIIQRIRGTELPNPVNANQEVARIIKKACAPNPYDRYQSASEMLDDLQKSLDKVDVASNKVLVNIPELNVNEVSAVTNGNGYVTSSDSSDSTDKTKGLDLGTNEDKPKDKIIIPVVIEENIPSSDSDGTIAVEKMDTTDNTTGIDTDSKPKKDMKQVIVEEQPKEIDPNENKGDQVVPVEVKGEDATSNIIPGSKVVQDQDENKPKKNKFVFLFAIAAVVIIGLSIWYFGFGMNQDNVAHTPKVMPDVSSLSLDQIFDALDSEMFDIELIYDSNSPTEPGTVLSQFPLPGDSISRNSRIRITVSAFRIPPANGLSLSTYVKNLNDIMVYPIFIELYSEEYPEGFFSNINCGPFECTGYVWGDLRLYYYDELVEPYNQSPVIISKGKSPYTESITSPNIQGSDIFDAVNQLVMSGVKLQDIRVGFGYSPNFAENTVIIDSMDNYFVHVDESKRVGFSTLFENFGSSAIGHPFIEGSKMPKYIGKDYHETINRLFEIGVYDIYAEFEYSKSFSKGEVISCNVPESSRLQKQTFVQLVVSLGKQP